MATGCSNTSSTINSTSTYRLLKQQQQQQSQINADTISTLTNTPNKSANTSANQNQNDSSQPNSTSSSNNNVNNFPSGSQNGYHENSHGLKIKTKSIENTLLPLVNQISTLVNFKDNLKSLSNTSSSSTATYYSEKTANALLRVGEAVSMAVERFVSVGEAIAYENPTIKLDMLEACKEARESGYAIKIHTQISNSISITNTQNEKNNLIQAANILLNSITKVLLLADVVIINQILNSKNKVLQTLNELETVIDFWNFVRLFTQYGNDLIELAHHSGERQNDLKDDKRRSQLSSARWILEKSTSMILSSSKAYLKHLECECAKENVGLVYSFLNQALDTVNYVVVDSGSMFDFSSPIYNNSMFKSSIVQISYVTAYRQFEDTLDLARNNMMAENGNILVLNALSSLIDSTQDFTDSLYINNEQRERITRLQNEIREQTLLYLKEEHRFKQQEQEVITDSNNNNNSSYNNNTENKNESSGENPDHNTNTTPRFTRMFKTSPILNDCDVLKKLLQSLTMQLANSLFRENQDATLLNCIKTYALSNHYDLLIETLDKFKEYSDHVLELCKLLRHISTLDVFEITCEHHYNVFENLSKMIQSAAGTAALYPTCKSATENLNLYCESWENQVNDLSVLVKEMQDLISGIKSNKSIYLSLPRPGKHGTSARMSSLNSKGSKLDSNEQAKIAKLGLEMKLITNEIEAEADKWNEPQNEIIKLAKLMSDMACEIHLFTQGQGPLKTTHDLFARAEIFLQHGVLLYGIIKEFLNQVPKGFLKEELIQLLERLPFNFKQLKNRLKQVTIGKSATFNKVDFVIQETRDFMNLVAKLVTNCFLCCTKYNINYDQTDQTNLNETNDFQASQYQTYTNSNMNNVNYQDNYKLDEQMAVNNNHQINQGTLINTNRFATLNNTINNRSDSCGPSFRAQSLQRTIFTLPSKQ